MSHQSSEDIMVAFAEFMYYQDEALEPWSSSHADEFIPAKEAFGASSGSADLQFEFKPMTPDEYEAETGIKLGNTPYNMDASYAGGLTDTSAWLHENTTSWFSDTSEEMKNWYHYRRASGTFEGAAFILPPAETGDAPWAEPLHSDWTTAVDNRTKEVDDVRGELKYLTENIIKASEDYTNVDLNNATDLELAKVGKDTGDSENDSGD